MSFASSAEAPDGRILRSCLPGRAAHERGAVRNERYTEGQKLLMARAPKDLNEEERAFLHRMLLPRRRYLPQTEEEGLALAEDILGAQKYADFLRVREDIRSRFGADGRWSAGDSRWMLYYRFSVRGRALCALGMDENTLHAVILFGAREREAFERERNTFSRMGICWTYDLIAVNARGQKELKFDVTDGSIYEEVLRLLRIRAGRKK